MSREVELGCKSWTSFASSCCSTAVQRTLSLWLCPSTAVETAVARCTSRWAMARGHRHNTCIVLAAVHGLSGLFRAVSAVEPLVFRPAPPPPPPCPPVPVPNKPSRFRGHKRHLHVPSTVPPHRPSLFGISTVIIRLVVVEWFAPCLVTVLIPNSPYGLSVAVKQHWSLNWTHLRNGRADRLAAGKAFTSALRLRSEKLRRSVVSRGFKHYLRLRTEVLRSYKHYLYLRRTEVLRSLKTTCVWEDLKCCGSLDTSCGHKAKGTTPSIAFPNARARPRGAEDGRFRSLNSF